MTTVEQNRTAEWCFASQRERRDPFNEVSLEARFVGPDGRELAVPAFWAGGRSWKVRFSSPVPGAYRFRTACSDASDQGLHGQEGACEVLSGSGGNPLYRHGPVRVAEGGRRFEHLDGTPFFWLGDTWWMGLCQRLSWPDGFRELTADRVAKGFTAVQIVAGLYPDMPAFDERGAHHAEIPYQFERAALLRRRTVVKRRAVDFSSEVEQNPDFVLQRGNQFILGQYHQRLLASRLAGTV